MKLEEKLFMEMEEEYHDQNNPEFRPVYINGEESNYIISNCGDIFNIKKDRFISQSINEFGYVKVKIRHGVKTYDMKVHRLVAQAFILNPENKPEVNHIDGNKIRNWYKNLEWVTSKENKQHAIEHGYYNNASFTKFGMDKPNSIYNDEQIHEICKLLEKGKQPKEISELMNVPISLPSYIKYCGKWSHISSQYCIPKVGDIPRYQIPKKSKIYTHDQIHKVCKLLEDGYSPNEISKKINVHSSLPSYIRQKRAWTSISKEYNIPEYTTIKYDYTINDIHNICKLLEEGKEGKEIKEIIKNVSPSMIYNIKAKRIYTDVSKNYNIPEIIVHKKANTNLISKILLSGETDFDKIIEKLGMSDTRESRKYIASVKYELKKKQSSTTIENTKLV